MALETMSNVKEINGVKIAEYKHIENGYGKPDEYIWVRQPQNTIEFTIQNGPIKEVGVNGCQVTDMIAVARHIINNLNQKFPCRENAMTVTKLDEALMWQQKRTEDREARNVEGKNEK